MLIRAQKRNEGLGAIEKAYELSPDNQRFAYVYAIALHDFGRTPEAIKLLEKFQKKWPNSSAIRRALAEYQQSGEK